MDWFMNIQNHIKIRSNSYSLCSSRCSLQIRNKRHPDLTGSRPDPIPCSPWTHCKPWPRWHPSRASYRRRRPRWRWSGRRRWCPTRPCDEPRLCL